MLSHPSDLVRRHANGILKALVKPKELPVVQLEEEAVPRLCQAQVGSDWCGRKASADGVYCHKHYKMFNE